MYRRRDFELITISIDSPSRKNAVLSLLKQKQASCWNYICDGQDTYSLMTTIDKSLLGGIPYVVLVRPGGEVIYRALGVADPHELKKAIVGYVGRYYK
jgi:hypothetical protein